MKTARRSTLVLLSLLGLFPRFALARRGEVKAVGVSAYFAPQLADRLVPGVPLAIQCRDGTSYLLFGGHVVGRLPEGVVASSARVSRLREDDDGRTRLFVELA